MPEMELNTRTIVVATVTIVLLIVAYVAANLAFGTGKYVLTQLAQGLNIPYDNLTIIKENQLGIVTADYIIFGVAVLAIFVGMMLKYLVGGVTGMAETAG